MEEVYQKELLQYLEPELRKIGHLSHDTEAIMNQQSKLLKDPANFVIQDLLDLLPSQDSFTKKINKLQKKINKLQKKMESKSKPGITHTPHSRCIADMGAYTQTRREVSSRCWRTRSRSWRTRRRSSAISRTTYTRAGAPIASGPSSSPT
jgi:seryl-tRNA synthetase